MLYKYNDDLPDSVRNNILKHAQDIYRKAFNHAYIKYEKPFKRKKSSSQEETAHKVAWAAVKKEIS